MTRRRPMNCNAAPRCSAAITLRDGSGAQCMRHSKVGALCRQHAKIAARGIERATRWPGGFEANGQPKQNAANDAAVGARLAGRLAATERCNCGRGLQPDKWHMSGRFACPWYVAGHDPRRED